MAEVWLKHFMYSAPSFVLAGLLSLGIVALLSSQSFPTVLALVAVTFAAYFTSVRLAGKPAIQELGLAR